MCEKLCLQMKIVMFLYFLARVIRLIILNFKIVGIYIDDLFKCDKLL